MSSYLDTTNLRKQTLQVVNTIANSSTSNSYPTARAGCYKGSIIKRSLTGLNSEFSFSKTGCHTKFKEYSLLYYLPMAGGKIVEFLLFPKVIAFTDSSRIWTQVAVSISNDENHYTTGTSTTSIIHISIYMSRVILIYMCRVTLIWLSCRYNRYLSQNLINKSEILFMQTKTF